MKAKNIAYWVTTVLVAFFIGSGGIAQAMRVPGVLAGVVQLGYPVHFVVVLGVWKTLGAVALLVPRFPRLKEWAYAGIFFELTGASVAQAVAGNASHVFMPLVLTALLVASWALRPESRKLPSVAAGATSRATTAPVGEPAAAPAH